MEELVKKRELTPPEFAQFIDGIIDDMRDGLPKVSQKFVNKAGRGAICLHFENSAKPQTCEMGLGYVTPEQIPDHKFLTQVVREYDPTKEAVIFATKADKQVQVVRHIRFHKVAG